MVYTWSEGPSWDVSAEGEAVRCGWAVGAVEGLVLIQEAERQEASVT